mmetsp:Transcript_17075/g.57495  ORF Transcript_17075/g.57495 Transcript_17075/m.57495 type:complete len:252 (+) Transcript_17075:971-1726(+)
MRSGAFAYPGEMGREWRRRRRRRTRAQRRRRRRRRRLAGIWCRPAGPSRAPASATPQRSSRAAAGSSLEAGSSLARASSTTCTGSPCPPSAGKGWPPLALCRARDARLPLRCLRTVHACSCTAAPPTPQGRTSTSATAPSPDRIGHAAEHWSAKRCVCESRRPRRRPLRHASAPFAHWYVAASRRRGHLAAAAGRDQRCCLGSPRSERRRRERRRGAGFAAALWRHELRAGGPYSRLCGGGVAGGGVCVTV